MRATARALCGLLIGFAVTARAFPSAFPAEGGPTCLTSGGRTACGFYCAASSGQVQCAQTPQGVCAVGSGTVACWDPPPLLQSVFPLRFPRPHCVASSGQLACGYQCIANYDRVACAQTPFGACRANEGRLVCWDPPVQVIATRGALTRPASCLANYGQVGCGYNCIANYGQVRCAKTPEGFCRAERDTVFCWDPPSPSFGLAFDVASERACLTSTSGSACGYACLATERSSACGSGREDMCRADQGTVRCRPSHEL